MATNKPISAFPDLPAGELQPDDILIGVDVSDTSSSSSGTTKSILVEDLLNNPNNGTIAGEFVPATASAPVAGGIVQTAQNGMTFESQGGTLTDFNFLDAAGDFLAAMRSSDGALMGGKLMGVSAVPTIVPLAGAGTGATATVVGSNSCGVVTLTTGSSTIIGDQWTLTFSNAYANGVVGVVQHNSLNFDATSLPILLATTTVTTLTLRVPPSGALDPASIYYFNYQVLGYGN